MEQLLETARSAVEAGRAVGADEVEAYISASHLTSVKVQQGRIELYTTAETRGLGLRVFQAGKRGYAFATDLSEKSVRRSVQEALANARVAEADPLNGLPERSPIRRNLETELEISSPAFGEISAQDRKKFALGLEEDALAFDRRVKGAESCLYADEETSVYLANSRGFSGRFRRTAGYCFLVALAEEKGETQTGFSFAVGRHLGELDGKAVSLEAAEQAVSLLGARPISPRKATVVLDATVSAQVLSSLSSAMTAEAAQKGRSFLAGKVGRRIAAPGMTIIDDGRLKRGLASQPFDDEGVPTERTEVVSDGLLRTFLYDAYTAKKEKRRSTGNAHRASFKSVPSVASSNLFLEPTVLEKAAVIGGVSAGLFVTSVAGLHAGVNPITGQFSVGASGLWIEQGKTTFPVREVTIASTLQEMLENISAVGSDLRFMPMGGATGAPTLAIENMVISGR